MTPSDLMGWIALGAACTFNLMGWIALGAACILIWVFTEVLRDRRDMRRLDALFDAQQEVLPL